MSGWWLVDCWRGIGGNVGIGALLGRQSESALAALVSLAVAAQRPRDGGAHKREPGKEPQE